MVKIMLINGPNLNILGVREPGVYGVECWSDIECKIRERCSQYGFELETFQSNHEGAIVDYIQQSSKDYSGVIINPAAFTINSYSILEALIATELPFIEVHMSNIFARKEEWHSKSIFTTSAVGMIIGFQGATYCLAVDALHEYFSQNGKLD